jgi:hypothetical protein
MLFLMTKANFNCVGTKLSNQLYVEPDIKPNIRAVIDLPSSKYRC